MHRGGACPEDLTTCIPEQREVMKCVTPVKYWGKKWYLQVYYSEIR
jgi:hypothetical protein